MRVVGCVARFLPYLVAGVVIVPLAIVMNWWLQTLLGDVMPHGSAAKAVLSFASTFIACFVAAFGVVLVSATIAILEYARRLLARQAPWYLSYMEGATVRPRLWCGQIGIGSALRDPIQREHVLVLKKRFDEARRQLKGQHARRSRTTS